MMNVAIGGPPTHANEISALVFITSEMPAPARRSSANKRVAPTAPGPPKIASATTATGSAVTRARTTPRATVKIALISMGRR